MSVQIKPIIDHEQYEVNGKLAFKDQDGNWQCASELSQIEKNAFRNYGKLIVDNPRIKKHPKSTYKG